MIFDGDTFLISERFEYVEVYSSASLTTSTSLNAIKLCLYLLKMEGSLQPMPIT